MCQKLAQITFDDSLTSQNSSDDGNTQFAWNVNDEENLDRLFHDKQPNSQRLVNMLRIQEDRERHSRRLQRQINKNKGLEQPKPAQALATEILQLDEPMETQENLAYLDEQEKIPAWISNMFREIEEAQQ